MKRRIYLVIPAVMLLSALNVRASDFHFVRAISTAGHFSVSLPKPFREFPENFGTSSTATIRPKQSFVIGSTPAPGVIFVATKVVYNSASDARSVVKKMTAAEPPGFTRTEIKKVESAGLPGLEIKSLSRSTVGYRRVLVAGDTLFTFSVEAPAAKHRQISDAAKRFFDSLILPKAK
jgi:hypothetical protein